MLTLNWRKIKKLILIWVALQFDKYVIKMTHIQDVKVIFYTLDSTDGYTGGISATATAMISKLLLKADYRGIISGNLFPSTMEES